MIKPPFTPAPRPDFIDSLVGLWLQGAVTMAHLATASFAPVRQSWPEHDAPEPRAVYAEGEIPAGMGMPSGPSTVSPIRPEDLVAADGCTETCADCRFYRAENAQAGTCRRFAPGIAEDSDVAFWPITAGREWCGEFYPALTAHAPRH
ncbi:hypothetical protein ACLBYG_22305 [Methylobacterium sp. D53M]